ncbi:MAG: aminotransferase class III-fold pyridoxal phosphate-dependent enzyme [bacterium]
MVSFLYRRKCNRGLAAPDAGLGIQHFGVEPDILILGKAIASGMPLSAIVARSEIMEAWEAPAHLFTTGGSPGILCCRIGNH